MTGAVEVRAARPEDADGIGRVQVLAWRAAYRGVMPDDYLDGMDPAHQARFWRRITDERPPGTGLLVAVLDAAVVGFAGVGPQESTVPTDRGQLYAINLEPAAWGSGAGARLLAVAHTWLATAGYRTAVLWVAPGNARALAFYARHGWVDDRVTERKALPGGEIELVRYRRELP
jgi:GNAT superfamily N-acetyltransferase